MKDVEIIKEFYNQFYRAPTYKEYMALGGKKKHNRYYEFLKGLGYPSMKGPNVTIEVLKDNEVMFTGVSQEVADELDCSQVWVRKCVRENIPLKGYTLRYKLFKGYL